MAEVGYPDVTMTAFFGISAPAGTPAQIVEKLNQALKSIGSSQDIEKKIMAMNVLPLPLNRQETSAFIKEQSEKWQPVIKSLNIVFE
jgi:tripartite-type tricarboxylate transporter receptor subunit TctC